MCTTCMRMHSDWRGVLIKGRAHDLAPSRPTSASTRMASSSWTSARKASAALATVVALTGLIGTAPGVDGTAAIDGGSSGGGGGSGVPSQFELPYAYSNANASAVQQADFGLVLTSSEAYMSAVALQHCKSPTSLEMWMVYYSGYYPWLLDTLVHEWLEHTDEAYVCWLSIWPVSSTVSSSSIGQGW